MQNLAKLAYDLRKDTVEIIVNGKGGHIGGDMSVMEILVELYFNQMNISPENYKSPDRDRFILSKGHSVESLYAVLAAKGFFLMDEVKGEFNKLGSKYIGHPTNKVNGIEMNTGSLGHGLPICVGMALAGKMDNKDYRVYTVMGDGEMAEGSIYEALMAGAHYKLDNLCAVIDRNGLQISGSTEDVMAHGDLVNKIKGFGWNVIDVADGNNIEQLSRAFDDAKTFKGKPTMIIANTVKGKGSAVMENKINWHHKVPTADEIEQIFKDFEARKEVL